jgi:hypothetical protein
LVFSGLRTTLGSTTTQVEAVQTAYNSSQQELEELRAAALEVCQEVEEGEAQAGSSLASLLRALGGHVSQRMHRALHLGIKKALGIVASHYQVDFEVVSSGYVVPSASRTRWRWTVHMRSPPPPPIYSPRTSPTSCSPTLPWRVALKPESSWAFVPSSFKY